MPSNEQAKSPGITANLPEDKIQWGTILKIVFVILLSAIAIYFFLNPEVISKSVNSFIENLGPTGPV